MKNDFCPNCHKRELTKSSNDIICFECYSVSKMEEDIEDAQFERFEGRDGKLITRKVKASNYLDKPSSKTYETKAQSSLEELYRFFKIERERNLDFMANQISNILIQMKEDKQGPKKGKIQISDQKIHTFALHMFYRNHKECLKEKNHTLNSILKIRQIKKKDYLKAELEIKNIENNNKTSKSLETVTTEPLDLMQQPVKSKVYAISELRNLYETDVRKAIEKALKDLLSKDWKKSNQRVEIPDKQSTTNQRTSAIISLGHEKEDIGDMIKDNVQTILKHVEKKLQGFIKIPLVADKFNKLTKPVHLVFGMAILLIEEKMKNKFEYSKEIFDDSAKRAIRKKIRELKNILKRILELKKKEAEELLENLEMDENAENKLRSLTKKINEALKEKRMSIKLRNIRLIEKQSKDLFPIKESDDDSHKNMMKKELIFLEPSLSNFSISRKNSYVLGEGEQHDNSFLNCQKKPKPFLKRNSTIKMENLDENTKIN